MAAAATSLFALSQPGTAIAGPDLCAIAAPVATCSGNQSAGITSGTDFLSPPITTLNVNNLTQNIMPAAGVDGIQFIAPAGEVTINFDGGGFVINAPGVGSRGIEGRVTGNGNTTITSTGEITAHDDGAYGRVDGNGNVTINSTGNIVSILEEALDAEIGGNGNISVTSQGNLTSDDETIDATINGGTGGNITVNSTGNLTSNDDIGIDAYVAANGNIMITSEGNLMGDNEAINAYVAGNGDVSVITTGNLTSADNIGIDAYVGGTGNVNVTNTGDVMSDGTSIYAGVQNAVAGNVVVNSVGNLTSTNYLGLYGLVVGTGNVTLNSNGNINTRLDGIEAYVIGNGNIAVTSSGNITSTRDNGIDTYILGNGNISIVSDGNVTARQDGIDAYLAGAGNITVTSTGNLTSTRALGINTYVCCNGNINVASTGNIMSLGPGIFSGVGGNGNIAISSDGAVTSARAPGIIAAPYGTGVVTISTAGSVTGRTGILVTPRAANAAPATISSSAVITGTGGTAVDLRGDANDLLNLNGGSVIIGTIDFGNGNDNMGGTNPNDIDTLNVAPGVNAILTFADAGGPGQGDDALQSAPENIIGNTVLINGNTTAVAIDPTGFSAAQTWLDDITGSIIDTVEGLFAPGSDNNGDQQTAGFTLPGGTQVTPVAYTDAAGKGHRLWASSFGGAHEQDSGSGNAELDHVFGGLMFGAEGISGGGFRAGGFGGGSFSNMDVQFGAQNIQVASGFAGLYARKDWADYWIKAMITGGYASHVSRRRVNNAGVAGGIQTARGRFDGAFVAPALSAGARLAQPSANHSLWGSVRVHYGGLFLDGYTESGVAVPLTVRDRDVHILAARAQLSSPYTQRGTDGALFRFEGRVGIDAQFNIGNDRVNTTVAGTPFTFRASFDDELVSGFLGASLKRTTADGRGYLRATGEAHIVSDGSYELRGQFNAGLTF
ncbi:MAG: autotransporter domain-containing protein [Pseudomonadota bacterium]